MSTPAVASAPTVSADLPLVIVGAGPIGLAAAAHAQARGLAAVVLEAGDAAGSSVREWGHVRLFSPWRELIDPVAEKLLAPTGWIAPDPDAYPTGGTGPSTTSPRSPRPSRPPTRSRSATAQRVVGVARHGRDRLVAADREQLPFTIHVETPDGAAPGSTPPRSSTPRAPGPAPTRSAETATRPPARPSHADRITYGIPDLTDPTVAARYAGKHVAVAGAGASAQNVLVGLGALAEDHPEHPRHLAGTPPGHRRRLRRRRQRPARAARSPRHAAPGAR